jgi:hypothetical protein
MKYIQEITEWKSDWIPNHTYYVRDDGRKMVGYIRAGTGELVKFIKPLPFDSRGRKFITLKRPTEKDSVYFAPARVEEKPQAETTVLGSNGKKYTLAKVSNKWTCSCPGYSFRRKCKHADSMGA